MLLGNVFRKKHHAIFFLTLIFLPRNVFGGPPAKPIETISPKEFYEKALADTSPEKARGMLISVNTLSKWQSENSVVLVDVRNAEEYREIHIDGAINIPVDEITLENLSHKIPDKKSRIVVYCAQNLYPTRRLPLTTLGVPALKQHGYENTYLLEEFWTYPECANFLTSTESKKTCPLKFSGEKVK